MNYEDLNFENVDVNQSVEENQVMKGYTSIALVGLDSREGELDGDVNSDTMIIASINNDTKKHFRCPGRSRQNRQAVTRSSMQWMRNSKSRL